MNKNFDEFLKIMNSKSWDLITEKISSNVTLENPIETIIKANLEVTTTLLREYHEWLNS